MVRLQALLGLLCLLASLEAFQLHPAFQLLLFQLQLVSFGRCVDLQLLLFERQLALLDLEFLLLHLHHGVLLLLLGLLLWLRQRESLIDNTNKWLIWPCLAYAVGHMAIGLVHLMAWRTIDPYLPFVLLLLGVSGIRKYKPNALFFWGGLAVGAIGAACLAGYQALVLGARADGFNHAIQFGNAALLMGVLCLVRLLTVRANRWMDALIVLGFGAGLAASVWSQTRGGWLAVLLILAWMLINATQGWHLAKRVLAAVALLFVCWLFLPCRTMALCKTE